MLVLNNSQCLEGFPKPHVITQSTVKIVFCEEAQPFHPFLLVCSQLKLLFDVYFVIEIANVFEILYKVESLLRYLLEGRREVNLHFGDECSHE